MKLGTLIYLAFIAAGLGLAAQSAAGQPAPDAGAVLELAPVEVAVEVHVEPAPDDALGGILEAVRGGRWLVAVGGALWLLVYLLRSAKLRELVPFIGTRLGGYTVALGVPALAVIAAALYAGEAVSVELIFGSLGAGLVAIGLHQGRRDVAGE